MYYRNIKKIVHRCVNETGFRGRNYDCTVATAKTLFSVEWLNSFSGDKAGVLAVAIVPTVCYCAPYEPAAHGDHGRWLSLIGSVVGGVIFVIPYVREVGYICYSIPKKRPNEQKKNSKTTCPRQTVRNNILAADCNSISSSLSPSLAFSLALSGRGTFEIHNIATKA